MKQVHNLHSPQLTIWETKWKRSWWAHRYLENENENMNTMVENLLGQRAV